MVKQKTFKTGKTVEKRPFS